MRPVALVVPGSLDTRTGGYIYDRRLVEGLRQRSRRVDVVEIDGGFPYPTQAALDEAARAFAAIHAGTIVMVDSLALGAMPDLITTEASRVCIVALVHLPLSATVGLDGESAARFADRERRALGVAELIIVTGHAALPLLADFNLAPGRVIVVEPGTDPAPLSQGSTGERLELLSVATLNPGKGHEMLLEALSAVPHRAWHLTCAGSVTRHPLTAKRVRAAVTRLGLDDRVSLVGDLDGPALEECYARADVVALATEQETYGMAVAEALAHGLPVVATMTGAIPELVGKEAGLLVPVGDVRALVQALSRMLGDADLRARCAAGARRVRDRLPTWEDASDRAAAAFDALELHG